MRAYGKLLVSVDRGIKTITFHQPEKKNAVDRETTIAFRDLVQETAADDTKVLILTGTGADFCSGADLKSEMPSGDDVTEHLRSNINPSIVALRAMPKPVIAKVRGVAVGIGCNYALAADLRIASPDARFGQVFARIGLMPDGGSTYFLTRLIGYARAFEWMTSAAIYSAAQCAELGLINRVVATEDLDAEVQQLAESLANGPALAYAGIKRALNAGDSGTLDDALDAEALGQAGCIASADFREGVAAFVEKRVARFQGR